MDNAKSIFQKLWQEIKSKRGSQFLTWGGIIVIIFSCVGFSVGTSETGQVQPGTAASFFLALFLLVMLFVLAGGLAFFIIGGVLSAQHAIANKKQAPITTVPESIFSVEKITNVIQGVDLPIEKRREILQREINRYLARGFRVVSQTDTTAQLIKPKSFSCLWFLIFAFLLIGWIFYLAWYWAKKDQQVYIEVDIKGRVKTR